MGNGLRTWERLTDRGFQIRENVPLKIAFELAGVHAGVFEDLFSGEVAVGRVVLMKRVDGNTFRIRARGARESFAKRVVPFIGDADPIDRAEHNRFVRAEQDDAARAEAEVPF